MLRNRRGATSLRWLRALLDARRHRARPGRRAARALNDGAVLEDTLAGVLDQYPELASPVPRAPRRLPLQPEPDMRPHTRAEAEAVVDTVERWQAIVPRRRSGAGSCFAADEYYLLADRPFPRAGRLRGLPDARGRRRHGPHVRAGVRRRGRPWPTGVQSGLLRAGSTARRPRATAPRNPAATRRGARVTVVSLPLAPRDGARRHPHRRVRRPGAASRSSTGLGRADVRVVPVANEFFGGNTGVTGLMVGADLARVLADEPAGHRYLLPDVCLSEGRFLDGTTPADLPRPVEIVRHRRHRPARGPRVSADERPGGGRRRPAQRRQEHAREPHRRQAGGDRRGPSPASPATARRSRPSGWACRSCSSTPAAGCRAAPTSRRR